MKDGKFYKYNLDRIKVLKSLLRKVKGKISKENNVVVQVFYFEFRFIKDFYKRYKERYKMKDEFKRNNRNLRKILRSLKFW